MIGLFIALLALTCVFRTVDGMIEPHEREAAYKRTPSAVLFNQLVETGISTSEAQAIINHRDRYRRNNE